MRCACARAYGVYACGVLAVYCVAARCGECNACVGVERAARVSAGVIQSTGATVVELSMM